MLKVRYLPNEMIRNRRVFLVIVVTISEAVIVTRLFQQTPRACHYADGTPIFPSFLPHDTDRQKVANLPLALQSGRCYHRLFLKNAAGVFLKKHLSNLPRPRLMMADVSRIRFTAEDYANRIPEGCGVVGVYGTPDAARYAHLALYAMQHRGQESCGIATWDGERIGLHRGQGLVSQVFNEKALSKLEGDVAIGHVRYSTTGASTASNAQPLRANYRRGFMAVAHNGNLTNADVLSRRLEDKGAIFQSTSDSELLIHLIAQNPESNFLESLKTGLNDLQGAFSFMVLHDGDIYAVKDRHGFRPLCIGSLPGGGWIVASESCALDVCGAQFLRELDPGEAISLRNGVIDRHQLLESPRQAFCIFELIYYSRPDSQVDNSSIYHFRKRLGRALAREHAVEADVVIPVPDSSNAASIGYSRESGIPWEIGLIRSHYIGRTFIQPTQGQRDFGAKMKYNPVPSVLAGKRVVVVDDSVVRGTTAKKILKMVRDAGAREIHFRITAPPWKYPCYYGIDTPSKSELLANNMTPDEFRDWLEVESVGYISEEGLFASMPKTIGYCSACFSGEYLDGKPERESKIMTGGRDVTPTGGKC